jgi:SPOR domain
VLVTVGLLAWSPVVPASSSKGELRFAPSAGPYWVQVGAFRDSRAAAALADKLRAEKFRVHQSSVVRSPSEVSRVPRGPSEVSSTVQGQSDVATSGGETTEKYEIFVSGLSPSDLTARVASRGLSAGAAAGGAVVRPGVALPDAVGLSKDLAGQGFQVQVRRIPTPRETQRDPRRGSAPAPNPPAPAPTSTGAGETVHRVRVGGFPDRATAEAARRDLAARGYTGFLTREGE